MNRLENCEILLGVTGGIAAYKSASLCSQLVKHSAKVTVVMTESARKFIQPLTFSALSGRRVYSDMWSAMDVYDARHINLVDKVDLIVVAPATANIIAKMSCGICDDLLSTVLCSANCNILLAPAMNPRMWNNPATQRNVDELTRMGYYMVGPDQGRMACGDEGVGRMSEPDIIFERISEMIKKL